MPVDIAALNGQKGGVRSFLTDTTNPLLPVQIIVPTATSVKLNPSDSYEEVKETDCNGNMVTALKFLKESSTEIEVQLGNTYPELQALAMNKGNILVPTDTMVPFGVGWSNIPDSLTPTITPSTAGVYGFGLAADAVASAVVLIDGRSVPLTQSNFGSFSFASTRSFAVGANGELKFSADLAGKVYSLRGAQHTVANVVDTDGGRSVGLLEFEHHIINHKRELTIFQCSFSPERTGIDFSTPQTSFKGTIAAGAWRMRTLPRQNRC